MFSASTSTAKLDKALASAQGEFTAPERNRTVKVRLKNDKGEYSFDYATFDSILHGMAQPILSKHGVAVVQAPGVTIDQQGLTIVSITTRISHDGEWVESTLSGPCDGHNFQAIGSGLTYLARYSYCNMLGIAAEYDDDASAGSGHESTSQDRQPRAELPPCPKCGTNKSVIKGSADYGGGWVCWTKKDGCGHKWQSADAPPDKTKAPNKHDHTHDTEETMTAINRFGARIDEAVRNHDRDAMLAIADELKGEQERVKGVMRAKFASGLKIIDGEHIPPDQRDKSERYQEDSPI